MRLINQKGFTLIELVAVIGVLVVVSGVLLVNNRLNESQLSLNTDAAGIASAVSRAKALTLQNLSSDICGYGVSFKSGSVSEKAYYVIFKDIKDPVSKTCDNVFTNTDQNEILPGQESKQNLGNNIIFYNPGTSDSVSKLLITDVVFYSSDAKVKLTGLGGSICPEANCAVKSPAGMVIIQTESQSSSFKTLKITTSGQVTTKSDKYATIDNFDKDVLDEEGEIGDDDEPLIIEDCIEDCSCAIGLASGLTCRGVCGGTCYAGGPGGLQCSPDPLDTNCKGSLYTCGNIDVCGAPCLTCSTNEICQNNACVPCDCTKATTCGDIAIGTCGSTCYANSCSSNEECKFLNNEYQCIPKIVSGLRLDSIWPSATNKPPQ